MDGPADAGAKADAEHASERCQEGRFHQELEQDLDPARPERLPDADFTRPLRHRDRHDGHHADAADHQRDRGDDQQREKRALADLIPEFQERLLGGDVEVVGLIELEAVTDAHDAFDVRHRVADRHAVARQHGDHDVGDGSAARSAEPSDPEAEHALIRTERHDDEVVLVQVEPAGRRAFVEDADDLEALAADAHELPDRIDAARLEEQFVRRVAEHDDVAAVLDVRAVEEAAREKRDARALGEILARAEHDQVLRLLLVIKDTPLSHGARPPGAEFQVDVAQRGVLRLEDARVGRGEVRPLEQIPQLGAVRKAGHAEALHVDDVRSALRDEVAQRLIESADEGRHSDDGRDADDDAEDGETRAQLVDADGVERHHDDFLEEPEANGHGPRYSRLSASMGSSRAARIAG